jgi:glutaredoxin
MKAILILAGPYSSCLETKNIWQDLCLKNNIDFEMYDLTKSKGKEITKKMHIKSFPALIIENNVVAVGHPNIENAKNIIQELIK